MCLIVDYAVVIYYTCTMRKILWVAVYALLLLPALEGQADDRSGIDPLSLASILLHPFSSQGMSWNATGFIVVHDSQYYLITNWHVVTGRNPRTNLLKSGVKPDSLRFSLPKRVDGGFSWVSQRVPLYGDDLKPRWKEHPLGKRVDVVALPLVALDSNLTVRPVDIDGGQPEIRLTVTQPVSIIGFPKGLTGGDTLPIWKTGQIASEPSLDYGDLPRFVIDARTIGGMSGSPVVFRSNGSYLNTSGVLSMQGNPITKFVGVYSGRFKVDVIDKMTESDLGLVWKPKAITAILENIPTTE